jgi:hypothetical protein
VLIASDDFRQSHSLLNPVKPVVGLTSGFLCFLQPGWEGCRLKQHQAVARAECRLNAECSPETAL